jgi:ATP-dependent DNA helicase RecG
MRTPDQILELLPQLDQVVADELEDQDLDFKEWNTRSTDDAVKLVVEMAVCMANGGGGTVVFGVRDRTEVRTKAILGVHPPVPRNPALVDALAKLRLVNRSNLGIGRMFESFLIEGKEPPVIQESGESIIVTLLKQDVSAPFRRFVAEETKQGRLPGVDELLVLQYLLRHTELETTLAAELCQRPEAAMRNTLSRMERDLGWIQRGGTGRGTYWTLSSPLARKLRADLPESLARIDKEAAKTRILSILKQHRETNENGLSNNDLRKITSFDRTQVKSLMRELRQEHPQIQVTGDRKAARYIYDPDMVNP